jgi:hypothetical protein
MDNSRDAAQVKLLIPPKGCALLVTSRQHFALPGLKARNLDVLPVEESKKLLLEIAPRIKGEAEAITKLCGNLPQALRLAASTLKERRNLDPGDYSRRLGDEKQRLKLLSPGKDKDESVEASISLSYGLLNTEEQERWRMLGVFPDTFDVAAATAIWDLGGEAAEAEEAREASETLSKLMQFSMLQWNEGTKRYVLHDLMRDFARGKMEAAEREEGARRHAEHYRNVLAFANQLYLKGGESVMQGLALFDLEWGNIQAGQAWAAGYAADDERAARLCSAYPIAGVHCLNLRLHSREWINWLEAALCAARSQKDRRAEGAHLGNLGIAYFQLGEPRRAIDYYEQQLLIVREIGNRRGEGAALGSPTRT